MQVNQLAPLEQTTGRSLEYAKREQTTTVCGSVGSIVSLLVYLFCCCLFGNIKLVSPMLARCGGGDPGNIIMGWRFFVGLGCSTVSVGIIRSRGLACFSSGVGGSMSMVIVGISGGANNVCMGAAAMAGVILNMGSL